MFFNFNPQYDFSSIQNNPKFNVVPYKQIISTAWLDYGGYALNKQLLPAGHQMQTLFLNGTKKEMLVTM